MICTNTHASLYYYTPLSIVNNFASPIVDASMLAVVAGTFVYVGATEVIPEEWEDPEHKWKKFFALISGIVTIFAITQYTMTLEGF